jgi:hypothetical protein
MLRLFLSSLCAAILAASAPALADNVASAPQAAKHADEWSAAKRKRAVAVYPDYYHAPYPYRYGWRAADPSFDQYGRPYRNPFPGQCMIDLGYGRWESCSQVR